ncbi:ABC transporter ATP-binding protein [Petralouisia muris]|uniref:ABC transporter ATP-binding protein n=1 Tax=Petralouisia muris TaxID=3032872 RepID=A0AC61RQM7_9FIRM|nr:ABC transporter ATP-binding protein [Petralouisia muris]TGY91463.1 ABC transporter ATP-binding protein [Petralouisia muris]
MESKALVLTEQLSKSYKDEIVLNNVDLQVDRGKIVGFLGPSGAGKTTTIKIVTGQLKQTSGLAYVLGKDSRQLNNSIYQQIGIVTDNSGIYKKLSVYDNLYYFAKLLNVSSSRIDEVLKRTEMSEHRKKKAGILSKGQTQRLILARAILHDPKLLILDEPTSGLDPATASAIHKLLMELRQNGMGILLTTHNMEEADKLCDNILLLNEGRIVESGTSQAIRLKYNRTKKFRVLLKDNRNYLLDDCKETAGKIKRWMEEEMVETIHSCEPSLEEVFLKITGRSLNEDIVQA